MNTPQRWVNQQLAFAQAQLNLSHTPQGFNQRCHQQAAWIQLAVGLNAYAQELLTPAKLPANTFNPLQAPPYFAPALTLARKAEFTSSALEECAHLEATPSWLSYSLNPVHSLLPPAAPQSGLLQHTSLPATLIASSGQNPHNSPSAYSLAECLDAFSALIQRHRAHTQEY